jgi:hypothetical protein
MRRMRLRCSLVKGGSSMMAEVPPVRDNRTTRRLTFPRPCFRSDDMAHLLPHPMGHWRWQEARLEGSGMRSAHAWSIGADAEAVERELKGLIGRFGEGFEVHMPDGPLRRI